MSSHLIGIGSWAFRIITSTHQNPYPLDWRDNPLLAQSMVAGHIVSNLYQTVSPIASLRAKHQSEIRKTKQQQVDTLVWEHKQDSLGTRFYRSITPYHKQTII